MKKLVLAVLCLSLFAVCSSEIAYGSDEEEVVVVYVCNEQLLQKYPNVEAIKAQFGSEAKWQESTQPSIHEPDLELQVTEMEHSGVEMSTLGYKLEDEYRFFITKLYVKKAGFVDFLGVDVGSAREDVVKSFGEPQEIDSNVLIYHDEGEFNYIRFTIENNNVAEMIFNAYLD